MRFLGAVCICWFNSQKFWFESLGSLFSGRCRRFSRPFHDFQGIGPHKPQIRTDFRGRFAVILMCISQHTVFYLKKDLLPHLCLTKSTCSWIHFRFHQPFLLLCCIDLSEVHMSYHHHTLISQVLSSRHKPLQGQKPMQIMWQWSKTLQPRSILRRLSYNCGLPWPKQIWLDLWHDQGTPPPVDQDTRKVGCFRAQGLFGCDSYHGIVKIHATWKHKINR